MINPDESSVPSLDTMLNSLANRYRRRVLVALLQQNPLDGHDTLVPNDIEHDSEDLNSLKINMHHTHLPKLEIAGFIDWDQKTNTVRKGPQFEKMRPLLMLMRDHADELPEDLF